MIDPTIHATFIDFALQWAYPHLTDCGFWITPFNRISQPCLQFLDGVQIR